MALTKFLPPANLFYLFQPVDFWILDSMKEERVKDSVAKPLYLLLNEVFELRGMFKWLRRTLMVFVKVSFGRSINR